MRTEQTRRPTLCIMNRLYLINRSAPRAFRCSDHLASRWPPKPALQFAPYSEWFCPIYHAKSTILEQLKFFDFLAILSTSLLRDQLLYPSPPRWCREAECRTMQALLQFMSHSVVSLSQIPFWSVFFIFHRFCYFRKYFVGWQSHVRGNSRRKLRRPSAHSESVSIALFIFCCFHVNLEKNEQFTSSGMKHAG